MNLTPQIYIETDKLFREFSIDNWKLGDLPKKLLELQNHLGLTRDRDVLIPKFLTLTKEFVVGFGKSPESIISNKQSRRIRCVLQNVLLELLEKPKEPTHTSQNPVTKKIINEFFLEFESKSKHSLTSSFVNVVFELIDVLQINLMDEIIALVDYVAVLDCLKVNGWQEPHGGFYSEPNIPKIIKELREMN